MTRRPTILYTGTYERDYPRNQQFFRLLRQQGFAVHELHEPFWEKIRDKSSGFGSPLSMLRTVLTLIAIYLRLTLRLARALRGADAIVVGYIGQLDMLVCGVLARLVCKPVIFNPLVTLTDTVVEDRAMTSDGSPLARLIWLIDWMALKLASRVVTDTAENAGYLTETFGVPRSQVHSSHVGADERIFQPSHRGSGGSGLHVLFYGKMIPLHGVATILDAIRQLYESGDTDISFEIIGDGQQRGLLDEFRIEFPDAPVVYRTWVAYPRLAQRIASADVVLGIFGSGEKASRVVPNKVFQAMAVGAPIVTRDSPAIRKVLEQNVSAMLIPPGDSTALVDAIRALRDPEQRQRLGRGARASFEDHGSDAATGPILAAIIEDVMYRAGTTRASGRDS